MVKQTSQHQRVGTRGWATPAHGWSVRPEALLLVVHHTGLQDATCLVPGHRSTMLELGWKLPLCQLALTVLAPRAKLSSTVLLSYGSCVQQYLSARQERLMVQLRQVFMGVSNCFLIRLETCFTGESHVWCCKAGQSLWLGAGGGGVVRGLSGEATAKWTWYSQPNALKITVLPQISAAASFGLRSFSLQWSAMSTATGKWSKYWK